MMTIASNRCLYSVSSKSRIHFVFPNSFYRRSKRNAVLRACSFSLILDYFHMRQDSMKFKHRQSFT